MALAIKVRGRLADPTHIILDEPVNDLVGPVEVVVQGAARSAPPEAPRALFGMCADLGPAPAADEIDEARREAWAGFPHDDI
ncbi:MAG TPA: hypothetical protein VHK47_06685 [Polyangia bacterium]|jgi:hypothetical protein|nr:hypothetical protein [Polyangia bacterium]